MALHSLKIQNNPVLDDESVRADGVISPHLNALPWLNELLPPLSRRPAEAHTGVERQSSKTNSLMSGTIVSVLW